MMSYWLMVDTYVEDRLEGLSGDDVAPVIAGPHILRIEDVFLGQHLDCVEDVVTVRHSELVRYRHEPTSVLLRYDEDHNCAYGTDDYNFFGR